MDEIGFTGFPMTGTASPRSPAVARGDAMATGQETGRKQVDPGWFLGGSPVQTGGYNLNIPSFMGEDPLL